LRSAERMPLALRVIMRISDELGCEFAIKSVLYAVL
jgi:hypothetical protein